MISMESAEKLIEENAFAGEVERINVWNASGRICREDVHSLHNLPPFRASIKDGYAVIANDGKGQRKVIGSIEAGQAVSICELH